MPSDTGVQYHRFQHPIRTVAVIGAGAAGSPAARHLRGAGLTVRVFERQPTAGGIWNWSPDVTTPLSVPTPPPSKAAFFPSVTANEPLPKRSATVDDGDGQVRRRFSPPNPVYWALTNNVPTSTMTFKDFPYPPGTAENIPHYELAGYVRAYSDHFNLGEVTSWNTRVERAVKIDDKWKLTLHKIESDGGREVKETFWTEEFDALVAATGHYNAPLIPDIEGAAEWANRWPNLFIHSNGYRIPEPFTGKNVLIVGIGTSGIDISRDLSAHANKIYMVGKTEFRGPDGYLTMRKLQRHYLPDNGEAVPEIKRFVHPSPDAKLEDGHIELVDGRVISGVSLVIFATGYQYSYPFLPQFHHDPVLGRPSADAKSRLLVTDGGGVLNLYRDVFYIPDPTLAFLGLSVNTSAFNFFEYQSLALTRVWSGKARLPSLGRQREEYNLLVSETGEGKFSHFMGKEGERKYVAETVAWLNADAEWSGAAPIVRHTPEWLAASDRTSVLITKRYGFDGAALLAKVQAEIAAEKDQRTQTSEVPEESEGDEPPVNTVVTVPPLGRAILVS